jgi:hypothetical protein
VLELAARTLRRAGPGESLGLWDRENLKNVLKPVYQR